MATVLLVSFGCVATLRIPLGDFVTERDTEEYRINCAPSQPNGTSSEINSACYFKSVAAECQADWLQPQRRSRTKL